MQDLSRLLAGKVAPSIAEALWNKIHETRKLAKAETPDVFAALKEHYHCTVEDRTQDNLPLRRVVSLIDACLDHLSRTGPLVADALNSYSLNTIVLYAGDEIRPASSDDLMGACYSGGMADYELDECRLYIGAGRALELPEAPLTIGIGAHNVGTGFSTVLAHEIGHLIMPQVEVALNEKFRIVYDSCPKDFWARRVSEYAATDDHELFAEAFAAWTSDQYGTSAVNSLPALLEAIFIKAGIKSGAQVTKLAKARTPQDVMLEDGTVITASKIKDILEAVDDGDWFSIEGPLSDAMKQAFEDAGYDEINASGLGTTNKDLFDTVDQGAEVYAKDHGAELISGLKDSTRDMVQGTLEDALEEGWSRPEFEDELRASYGFSEQRASTIAYNELAMAHSYGRIDVAKEAGATKKVWLLSDDHDDAEDCDCSDAADAGEVDMDESFTDDADYDYPPGHVNCLCDWAAVYDKEDDAEEDDAEDEEEDADKATKTTSLAKNNDVGVYNPGNSNSERLYADNELTQQEIDAAGEISALCSAVLEAAPREDRTGQRITGRACAASRGACAGHESLVDRINDHRTAAELHHEAAKHYATDFYEEAVSAKHVCIAALHNDIRALLLDLQKLTKYNPDQPRDDHGRFEGGGFNKEAFKKDNEKYLSRLSPAEADKLTEIYRTSAEQKGAFDKEVNAAAKGVAGEAIIAPLKGADRATLKIVGDYKGNAESIKDLVRATVIVEGPEDAKSVLDHFASKFDTVGTTRNTLDVHAQTIDGYRDGKMNVQIPGDHIGEIQVNVKEMVDAKVSMHALYEERSAHERVGDLATNPQRAQRIDELNSQMRARYDAAWDAFLTRSKASKFSAVPLRKTDANAKGLGGDESCASTNKPPEGVRLTRTGTPSTSKYISSGSPSLFMTGALNNEYNKAAIDLAAHSAATSNLNDTPAPTDPQKHAGNYKKGHITVGGIRIAIENPAGTARREGWTTLKAHYGYIKLTTGADGDQIDVFVRVGTDSEYRGPVYIIDQCDEGGEFDEHKCMIGFASRQRAIAAYLGSYQSGWKLGPVTRVDWETFKKWVDKRTQTTPMAEG